MKFPESKLPAYIYGMVGALLLFAIMPLPYAYYTFMRIILFICASVTAYQNFQTNGVNTWVWIFGLIAVLFNPIAPIHMTKEIWIAVDGIVGIFFLVLAFIIYKKEIDNDCKEPK